MKKGISINFPEKIHKLVLDPLPAGTYSVGTGGYFPTIDSAFNKLSIDGIAGEVILELIDNLYTAPTDTFGFFLNGPIPGAGPNSRVTFKPAANKNVTIEGNNEALLYLINTSYVTFDGVGLTGETTLTIHTFHNAAYPCNDGIDFLNNSDHDVIQNITFIVEDNTRPSGFGFFCWSGSSQAPDSNLIQNNFVKEGGIALYVSSFGASAWAKGNIIRGNQIGSETDSLIAWGIQLEECQNTIVENNIVQNIRPTNITERVNPGINSYSGLGDIIRNNIVHNIKPTIGYSSIGILLSGGSGSNNSIYNNMIYDISSTSPQSDSRVAGIQIWLQNSPKIYYNTVYLSGNGANYLGSAAFYIYGGWGNSANIDAKNNILINTRDESPYCASAIYDYSASNLTSDYNDLYYEPGTYNCLVRIGGTNYNTLANWQATGQDLNSVTEMPHFVSPDLHIDGAIFNLLDGHATPIAGIDTDIDGETRNATLPDIGADEFELVNPQYWQVQNLNLPANTFVICLSAVNDQVCWGVAQIYPPSTIPYAGYIRTTDGGSNWVCDTIAGISNGYFQLIFAIDADTAYATVYVNASEISKGIYKTTNGGSSWNRQNAFNASQYGPGYVHFFDSQNGVVIGDPNLETYTTTNGGLTWNPVVMPVALSGELTSINRNGITAYNNSVWFGTGARIFKSTDRGYNWTIMVSEPQYINWNPGIAFQDSLIGIYSLKKRGALDHFYRKTIDGGVNWVTLSNSILDNLAPTALQHLPGTEATYIIGGGAPQGMRGTAVTYDAGESWSIIDTSANYQISFPSYIVGWSSQYTTNVVRKYVGPPLSVEEEQIDEIPTGYSLSQNYPNPFNPSTTFRYSIPQTSKVVIKVYDILGNEIATLMDEEKSVGTYELTWNASSLPSGVYFYQIKAGSYIETKKMMLLK
jgi:photosystem II stability/assembly factor-like uncharacterized protein